MHSVLNLPHEIWLLICNCLNIGELAIAFVSLKPSLPQSIIQSAGTRAIVAFLVDANVSARYSVDSTELWWKGVSEGRRLPRRSGRTKPLRKLYHPLADGDISRAFRQIGDHTEMVFSLDMDDPAPRGFHPCMHGPEPIEIIDFVAIFQFPATLKNDVEELRIVYNTKGTQITGAIEDTGEDDDGTWELRMVSHQLALSEVMWREGDQTKPWTTLPQEWIGLLGGHMTASLKVEKSGKPLRPRRRQKFTCSPFDLKDFKAIWRFSTVPKAVSDQLHVANKEKPIVEEQAEC
jgi:hypothetical protein